MRKLLLATILGLSATALLPAHKANAWWDGWGRWHPDFYRRPHVVVVPGPVYPPYYARPYARWVPPHYDPWGRFIPGHWV